MMRSLPMGFRRFVYALRTEGEGPGRETAAVAVGVFIGCLPVYGLHLLLCVLAGTLLRLNRLKTYLAANISNPFVAPWLVLAEVQAGAWMRRGAFHELSVDTLETTGLRVFAGDLLIGSVVVGGVLAGLAAWGTFTLVRGDRPGDRFSALARRASDRYAATSLTAWEFARGKLRFDPIYRALVCDGLLRPVLSSPSRTLVEIGCGQGLALAVIAEARRDIESGDWPDTWRQLLFDRVIGIEKRRHVAKIAADALGGDAEIVTADARASVVERADVILFLDVLHMTAPAEQERLLSAASAALSPGGVMVIREADAAGGWRFGVVTLSNRLKAFAFGRWREQFHFRSAAEWEACFVRLGLRAETRAMGQGTPFANVLFVVTLAAAESPSTSRTGTSTAGMP